MSEISFTKDLRPIEGNDGDTLMETLLNGGLPVASSCGGEGVCTKCIVEVLAGSNHLSPPNDRELELREQHNIPEGHRVSCQTLLLGPCTLNTPYW